MRTLNFHKPLTTLITLVALLVAGDLLLAPRAIRADGPPPDEGKSGSQLWAETCGSCHNFRSPGSYTPAQWEIVTLHMRVTANLTDNDIKKIEAFLKAGS